MAGNSSSGRGMNTWLSAAISLVALFAVTEAVATECRDDPNIVEQCVTVHARLRVTASMRLELWPIGAPRLFEIDYPPDKPREHYPFMPKRISDLMRQDRVVFRDFESCPLAHDIPGHIRYACIQSATHLVVRPPSQGGH